MKILLVEDHPNLQRVTAFALKSLGCQVFPADSIAAARAVLARQTVEAVFLDVCLRGENGLTLLDQLSAEAGSPPVVIFTSHSKSETLAETTARGACDFLAKPYNLEELTRVVDGLRKRLHRPTGNGAAWSGEPGAGSQVAQ